MMMTSASVATAFAISDDLFLRDAQATHELLRID
jgi:hypothetical protein